MICEACKGTGLFDPETLCAVCGGSGGKANADIPDRDSDEATASPAPVSEDAAPASEFEPTPEPESTEAIPSA